MRAYFRLPANQVVLLAVFLLGAPALHGAKPDFSGNWVLLEGPREEVAEKLEIGISATVAKGTSARVLTVGCLPSSATYPRCGDREFLVSGIVSAGGATSEREPGWFGDQLLYNIRDNDGQRRSGYSELWTQESDGTLSIRITPREGSSFSLVYTKRRPETKPKAGRY